jgi:hypothetical protein
MKAERYTSPATVSRRRFLFVLMWQMVGKITRWPDRDMF